MVKTRNQDEFKHIYEKFFDTIFRFVYLTFKNEQDSADITQDVFYKFYTTEKEFRDDEHIKAWLYTCAKNATIDFLRRKERKNSDLDTALNIGENMQFDETLPVLLQLDTKYKDVLFMYYYETYDTQEIAKILKIAHSTARIRLKRGRELLKEKLKGEY